MARRFSAAIFDWSGTLSDDFEPVYRAFCDNFRHFGVKPISREEYRERVELPFEPYYRKLGLKGPSCEIWKNFYEYFENYKSMIKPFPETRQLLEWLKGRGVEIAVLSAHPVVRREAEQYGIAQYFDSIGEAVPNKVEAIHEFMGKMRSHKNDTLFVGDMVHDIEAAHAAGIKAVAVLQGYDTEQKLLKAKPDYVIKTIGELKNLGLF